jgi:formylglycine-generating enzyme required for sulfatase activity
MMGSPENERGRWQSHESPIHSVNIGYDFFMGRTEVTQAQWQAIMGDNPSHFQPAEPLALGYHPVEQVSWNDCQTFIAQLNGLGLGVFRLPSDAEWEYACRGGTQTRFFFGDSLDCPDDIECAAGELPGNRSDYLWWAVACDRDAEGRVPRQVARLLPNPWGLYDIYGNLAEWVEDYFHDTYVGSPTDGSPWLLENPQWDFMRVHRSGDINQYMNQSRSAWRFHDAPDIRSFLIGVRLVLEVMDP